MYKCVHELHTKTVPDTSLHKMSDLIEAIVMYYVETTFMFNPYRTNVENRVSS